MWVERGVFNCTFSGGMLPLTWWISYKMIKYIKSYAPYPRSRFSSLTFMIDPNIERSCLFVVVVVFTLEDKSTMNRPTSSPNEYQSAALLPTTQLDVQVRTHLCSISHKWLVIRYKAQLCGGFSCSVGSFVSFGDCWRPERYNGVCTGGLGLDRFHTSPAQQCRKSPECARTFPRPGWAFWRQRAAVCCGSRRLDRPTFPIAGLEFPPRWRATVDPYTLSSKWKKWA